MFSGSHTLGPEPRHGLIPSLLLQLRLEATQFLRQSLSGSRRILLSSEVAVNMIDPASAIALATAAFSGIKRAVSAGKEISELGKDLSNFGRAVSDLDYMGNKAKDPPLWKKVSPGFDTSAIEIWAAQQKAKEMREELREHISLYYGPSAWKSIVNIEAEQRRLQKEAVYRRQERIDNIFNWGVGIGLVLGGLAVFGSFIYFMGKYRGTW